MSTSANNSLTVSFRGVRGSMPSPGMSTARYGGNTACVEVRSGNEILILDAGTGIRGLGTDLIDEFGSGPIEATLLISHTHWDHIQGLPFFAPAYAKQNRIRVMAAKGAGATVERALHNQMDPIHFPVGLDHLLGLSKVEELAADGETLGKFRVRVTGLNHPGGCAGFRIEANGGSLAYLPDHEPFESLSKPLADLSAHTTSLIEFVRGVDLLILDTQYTEAEYEKRYGWGHGCLTDSVALALSAGVRQLAFFHHDPGHDDDQMDQMIDAGRALVRSGESIVFAAGENENIVLNPGKIALFPQPLPRLATSAVV
jgi:phosphoribosyl 1,2-cyclic phosphodiesterase